MIKIETNLRPDERVLWQDKPKFAPFVLSRSIFMLLFGVVLLAFYLIFARPFFLIGAPIGLPTFFLLSMIVFLIIMFAPFILTLLAFRKTEYIITDKRVIAQTGAIGLDTRFVDLEKIQEVSVKVGLIDRFYSTGSIHAVTAGQPFLGKEFIWTGSNIGGSTRPRSLSSLEKTYEVQKLLQEAIQDVKKVKT